MNRRDFLRWGATTMMLAAVGQGQEIYDYNPVTGSTSVVITKPSAELPPVNFRVVQSAYFKDGSKDLAISGSPTGDMLAVMEAQYYDKASFYDRKAKRWTPFVGLGNLRKATSGASKPYQFLHLSSDKNGFYAGASFYDWDLWLPSIVYFTRGQAARCLIHPNFYVESAKRTGNSYIAVSTGPDGTLWSVSGQKTNQPYHGGRIDVLRGHWSGGQFRTTPMILNFKGPVPPGKAFYDGCADWRGGYVFYTGQTLFRIDASGTVRPLVNLQLTNDGSTYGKPMVDGKGDIWIPVVRKFKSVGYSHGDGTYDVSTLANGRSRLVRVRMTAKGTIVQEISGKRLHAALGLPENEIMKTYRLAPDPKNGGLIGYDAFQKMAYHIETN